MSKFLDINIDELREVLGFETRSKYGTYYFQCPECASMGKDTKKDNLVFNSSNGKLRCFGCGEGQYKAIGMVNEMRKKNGYWQKPHKEGKILEENKNKKVWFEVNKEELLQYQKEAEEELLEAQPIIDWLYNKHCINKQTIKDCGIGLDADKNAVCFPIYSTQHDQILVGFEYRQCGENKKIWRTPQAPSCLASVYGRENAENIIICEGFKDAYCLKQILDLKGKTDSYYILTPANGVSDIINHLPKIDFNKYRSCYLLLDNDEAGDKATTEILEQYPFFIDKRKILKNNNVNDVADYWRLKYAN